MKDKMKRTIVLIMAVFLLAAVLTACTGRGQTREADTGRADGAETSDYRDGVPPSYSGQTISVQYSDNYYPFPSGYLPFDIARIDNRLMIAAVRDTDYALGIAEYTAAENGRVSLSETETVQLDIPEAEGGVIIYSLAAGEDGYFYILAGDAAEEYTGNYYILRYTPDGEPDSDKTHISYWPEDMPINAIDAMGDGYIVAHGSNFIAAMYWTGEIVEMKSLEEGDWIASSSVTKNGVVFSTLYGSCYLLKRDTGEWVRLLLDYAGQGASLGSVQGLDGEYIISSGTCFYLFDLYNKSETQLLVLDYFKGTSEIGPACRLSEESYACVIRGSEALCITGMERVPETERSVVKVALVGVGEPALAEMNISGGQYVYQAVSYSSDEITRFLTELVTGNTPDLVLFESNINTDSDYFDDLYQYIDADPDMSRDDFLPNFLEALSVNDKLHQLWDQTCIYTLDARVSDVGDGRGLTPADYNRIVAESEKYEAVFEAFMDKNNLLQWISRVGISACLDREDATCSFDSDGFRQLLEWCGTMGNGFQEGTEVSYGLSESMLFFESVQGLERIQYLPKLFGEPLVCVGFPDGGDGYSYYSISQNSYGISMAIPSGSVNKDGAWAYIKNRLSLENQMNIGEFKGLPVNYNALCRIAQTKLSDEAREILNNLLERTKYAEVFADQTLLGIIVSCGQSYINGDKSLEDTVDLIQSKASLYVAEQYG